MTFAIYTHTTQQQPAASNNHRTDKCVTLSQLNMQSPQQANNETTTNMKRKISQKVFYFLLFFFVWLVVLSLSLSISMCYQIRAGGRFAHFAAAVIYATRPPHISPKFVYRARCAHLICTENVRNKIWKVGKHSSNDWRDVAEGFAWNFAHHRNANTKSYTVTHTHSQQHTIRAYVLRHI